MNDKWVAQECPKCGARLIVAPGATHCRCNYCDNEFHRDPNVVVDHPGKVDWANDPDAGQVKKKKEPMPVAAKVVLIIFLAPVIGFFAMLTIAVIVALFVRDDTAEVTRNSDDVYEYIDYTDGSDKFVPLEDVNPFDNITWTYSGLSGDAYFHGTNSNPYQYGIDNVVATPKSGLSNGDKVTISITHNKDTAARYGYRLTETKKEIIVDGLDEYASDLSALNSSYLEKMQKYATDKLNDKDSLSWSDFEFDYTDWEYLGWITLVKKNAYSGAVYLVYKSDITYQNVTTTVYTPVLFKNVIVSANGDVRADWNCTVNQSGSSTHVGTKDSYKSVYGFNSYELLKDTLIQNSKADYYVNYSLE